MGILQFDSRKKYFDGVGTEDDMIFIGWEDDGQIGFRKSKYHYGGFLDGFNIYWIKFLIADLQAALDASKEKK